MKTVARSNLLSRKASRKGKHFSVDSRRLHRPYWNRSRSSGSVCSSDVWSPHVDLFRTAFAAGAVQLCRITAGDAMSDIFYNFVWRGWVYAYQSGFHYERDNRFKPGQVSHCLAGEHALSCGHSVYDFMGCSPT